MELNLSGPHQRTFDAILRHPASHNLHWRDVRSLLSVLAEVIEEPNGKLKVSRAERTLILHPERHKDVATVDELMDVRRFLEDSDPAPATDTVADGAHLLVVLDHREARVYRTEVRGSIPQRIAPLDPRGAGRHLRYVQDDSSGQRRPERRSFYEAIAKTLHHAEKILIFGAGTGASSAMGQLVAELTEHHKDVAGRIVGSVVVDEHHLTEDQLLARAREFYASPAA